MSELELEKLAVGYGKKPLVSDISLLVKQGKIVALIGPNGVGKSTILRTVAGMLSAVSGNILIGGKNICDISKEERAKTMSVMTTGRRDTEYSTCFDVVSVGRYQFTGALGRLKNSDVEAVEAALEKVGAASLRDKEFLKLSDGQKQRILLARAIVQEPEVMILDEPTSFLDIGYKLEFIEKLKNLVREKNIGVLMAMHELELVRNLADVVACISEDGSLDRVGTPEEVFETAYIERLFGIKSGKFEEVYGLSFCQRAKTVLDSKEELKEGLKEEEKERLKEDAVEEAKERLKEAVVEESKGGKEVNSEKKTSFLMIQGTMSSAGKSLIAAGLCRIFKQDGFRVSPFKSQNMALNSYITEDGLEMGRAQVMQAEAAGVVPSVYMNPILLKPTDDCGSQVIVNGRVVANMRARDYFEYKKKLIPDIKNAISKLEETSDIIIIEGAGSPAEINLKQNDIVNMGMAELVDAPVLLVGDIDRGGVFAQLLGTLELLETEERNRVRGLVVNKFRGDKTILDPGIEMLERMGQIPVVGVVPYIRLNLDDEDSLTERFSNRTEGRIKIGIVRLPHISNFTDFDVFEQLSEVALNYISKPSEVEEHDLIILPGSKNTIADMKWLKETGFETAIKKYAAKDNPVIGICGGYQMLGNTISDPEKVEGGGTITGLQLLPVDTVLKNKKHRSQTSGYFGETGGIFAGLKGKKYTGYEIHMGETLPAEIPGEEISEEKISKDTSAGKGYSYKNIYGTYIHGIFDDAETVRILIESLAEKKGIDITIDSVLSYSDLKEREFDRLADTLRVYMDIDYIYEVMGLQKRD